MASRHFQVFLSSVTSEFGKARDGLAADLRSRGLRVRVQSDFRQEAAAGSTLEKLRLYIKDCNAIVFVLGRRAGAVPPAAAAIP